MKTRDSLHSNVLKENGGEIHSLTLDHNNYDHGTEAERHPFI